MGSGLEVIVARYVLSCAGAVFLAAQVVGGAQASTVTYDLALTPILDSPEGGTGYFTVNGPVATTGLDTFTVGSGGLDALDFSIDNQTFTLGNSLPGVASVTFLNGQLNSIIYGGATGGFNLILASAGLDYTFLDISTPNLDSVGTITDPPAVTPLPPTWTMMLLGLAGLALVLYRRKGRAGFMQPLTA